MNFMMKIGQICIIFMSVIMVVIVNVNEKVEAAPLHRVLFISSYHGSFATYPELMEGLTEVFYEEGILFDIEFMDTNRFDVEENYANFYQFLKYRLDHSESYDVILVSDDNGLQFLMDHKKDLVGNIPVIFFAINDLNRVLEAGEIPTFTGIYEAASIEENLKLAMKLQPQANTFYVVADDTATGQGDVRAFLALKESFPDMDFKVLNFSHYEVEDFKKRLNALTNTDILIYMTMFNDKNKNTYTISESVNILSEAAPVPIYRPTIGGVGQGLLGGYMLSYSEQGKMAAQMALDVLNGMDIKSIPTVNESPNKYIIDYQLMERYALDMEKLPEDVIFVNKPITFFERYNALILPFSLILGASLIVLIFLYIENKKNYGHAIELYNKNEELSALYEELSASEEELRYQYDELSESRRQLLQGEKKLKQLAYHDALTGLYNRAALFMKLNTILNDPIYEGELYYMDLDNFKYINDTGGHKLGDDILKKMTNRFKDFEDDKTIIARVGGDEFVIVYYWNRDKDKRNDDIHKQIVSKVEKRLVVHGEAFHMSCSIGVVNFPSQGRDVEELIRKADIAMYQAKDKGRARTSVYRDFMDLKSANILSIQKSIFKAIEENQFKLFLQPQVNMQTEEVIAFEGLIRWEHPEKGRISPMEFIPIAEQLGVIHNIGKWVYNEACQSMKTLIHHEFKNLKIAVNVSAVELTRIDFEADFIHLLKSYNLDVNSIAIELTESIFMEATEIHLNKIKALRESGISLHLDDFGTGYSSLKYLMDLPIDVVKIDREFIKNINQDQRTRKLLSNIIKIIHDLDMKIIAEGIETKEQHQILKDLGCDMAQGYYYAKPMSFEDILVRIRS